MHDKAFHISKKPKYDGYQRGLASTVYKSFDKKTFTCANKFADSGIKKENILNKELREELHKPIIKKFEKGKVHSSFIDNIWAQI